MIGLANYIEDHREAIERDLLVETGRELGDVGGALSWGALKSFLTNVKPGSALAAEINPALAEWATTTKTNAILADIFDQLSMVNASLRVLITHKPGRQPTPYKRPGKKEEKHIGKDALPSSKMRSWLASRLGKEVVKRGDD